MIYSGQTDEHEVLLDTQDNSLLVSLRAMPDVTVFADKFANPVMLSENLRDIIGFGPAVHLLTEWEIPTSSPLWRLGKKG